ncbi:MAG: 4-hydroxythreonine-4-phosphate dehydrogenase PdxA [Opitutaceae bacterium]
MKAAGEAGPEEQPTMEAWPVIGVTSGDPAGIGPEVVESWLASSPDFPGRLRLFGPTEWTRRVEEMHGHPGHGIGPVDYHPISGHPDPQGASIAWEALRAAAEACRRGTIDAVVTGPISKAALAQVGFKHPGQTEFFASSWGGEPVMAFTGGRLRVALATWHLPLSEVPKALNPEKLERTVRAVHDLARADGVDRPRLVVCGLNPHAGEGGLLGGEERDWINPLLERIAADGLLVGPAQPGDTVFARMLAGEYDAIVALYHDQGLAPLKAVDFDSSVNVTLGLPYVRTSPDHGTAFGIAGKGLARFESMANAVRVAKRLVGYRRQSRAPGC